MGGSNKPFFADGSIVGDYTLLLEYWKILKEKGMKENLESAFLRREDFEYIREIASRKKPIRLDELIEGLVGRFEQRIDPGSAVEAVRKALKANVDQKDAVYLVARIISGWLIEASKTLGIIRLREK